MENTHLQKEVNRAKRDIDDVIDNLVNEVHELESTREKLERRVQELESEIETLKQ